MLQLPERPFIPSSASSERPPAAGVASFQLARPFVHGVAGMSRPAGSQSFESLPPIADFLDNTPEYADAYASPGRALDFPGETENSHELPPVEHFLDPLPPIDEFSIEREDVLMADSAEEFVAPGPTYSTEESEMFGLEERGWLDTGWQQFDWSGAAALGEGSAEASDAWQETDWETTAPPVREFRETAAQAIANALDEIAHRIRNGELIVPAPNLASDPAAIAATLAALLGVRR